MNKLHVLILSGFMPSPVKKYNAKASLQDVISVVSNMAYYGYIPSKSAFDALMEMDRDDLANYWKELETGLSHVSKADREMDKFVVYQNFPDEVLNMSDTEYFFNQIKIYWGVDQNLVGEDKKERAALTEKVNYTPLSLSNEGTYQVIFNNLAKSVTAWTVQETEMASVLFSDIGVSLDLSDFKFKLNGISLINQFQGQVDLISIKDATDVIRLAAAMSEQEISLRGKIMFKKFNRKERRFLLTLLDRTKNIQEDFAMRKALWKRLLKLLHPSDYNFKRVITAYNELYNNNLQSFEGKFKSALERKDVEAIRLAKTRVGFFIKNLHWMYSILGTPVLEAFVEVADQATVIQLVKLVKYIETVNGRKNFMVAPAGNWKNVKNVKNEKAKFPKNDVAYFYDMVSKVINAKLSAIYPNGVVLDEKTKEVKIPTNDLELDFYGRGTSFDIPANVKTLRTASFWAFKNGNNNWIDNSFNFYRDDFSNAGICCYCRNRDGAIFAGDPVNSEETKGRAAQLIDLDIDKLVQDGVRYAVWSGLSYNSIPFKDFDDIVMTMELCEDARSGNLYEPSRAKFKFDITGDNLVKYIAYIDLVERKVIFTDLNLRGGVQSAANNIEFLAAEIPNVIEHLNCSPSVYDVFKHMDKQLVRIPMHTDVEELPLIVVYSDESLTIPKGSKAFVMEHVNEMNEFEKVNIKTL